MNEDLNDYETKPLVLSEEDAIKFIEACENPPEPSEALKEGMKSYWKQLELNLTNTKQQ